MENTEAPKAQSATNRHNEYVKAYLKNNPEKRKTWNRNYYQKHREQILERQKQYQAVKRTAKKEAAAASDNPAQNQ